MIVEKIHTYIISNEINKGTKITSNPLEKLTDHCVEHKINMRNDEGRDSRSQHCSARTLLSTFFFTSCVSHTFSLPLVSFFSHMIAWLFVKKSQEVQTNSPR